jgi:uncharacterized membrane-anchored protein
MKSLFGLIVVLVLGLVSGAAYLLFRPVEKRTSDWQRMKVMRTTIWNALTSIGRRFTNVFAATSEPAPAKRVG